MNVPNYEGLDYFSRQKTGSPAAEIFSRELPALNVKL